jgi:hypothetical protein
MSATPPDPEAYVIAGRHDAGHMEGSVDQSGCQTLMAIAFSSAHLTNVEGSPAGIGGRPAADPALATVVAITLSALIRPHPLSIQAVACVVQRMTSMGALFYLAAPSRYIEARRSGGSRRVTFACAAAVAALLAAGCEKNTWLLPVAVVIYKFGFHWADWRASSHPSMQLANDFTAIPRRRQLQLRDPDNHPLKRLARNWGRTLQEVQVLHSR